VYVEKVHVEMQINVYINDMIFLRSIMGFLTSSEKNLLLYLFYTHFHINRDL